MENTKSDELSPIGLVAAPGSEREGEQWSPAGSRRRSERARELPVLRLPEDGPSLEVALIRSNVPDRELACLLEHRQDFHTIYWLRRGKVRQFVDGVALESGAPMLTVVGRGQVYRYEDPDGIDGAVISFTDDLVYEGPVTRVNPVWLVGRYGAQSVRVPSKDAPAMDDLVGLLASEAGRAPDAQRAEVQRHLLLALLLQAERYYDAARVVGSASDDMDARLYRRFVALLERDFAYRHDVDYYAGALRVPTPVLARALSASTGQPTKALITDRVMLEATRLLRFTDLRVGEIASRVGLGNQFYFSRAFKQRYGESPQSYRARLRDAVLLDGTDAAP
jgi:AraC family transcriptional activator of pobA